jgi:hypothetical protein
MARRVRDVRAIPLWLLREYVERAGGREGADGALVGDGWTARLTQIEDVHVGSLRIGRVRLEIEGAEEALARLLAHLEPRLVRGGG